MATEHDIRKQLEEMALAYAAFNVAYHAENWTRPQYWLYLEELAENLRQRMISIEYVGEQLDSPPPGN